MAQVSIWKFVEYIRANNIWPPLQSEEKLEKEWKQTKKFLSS